MKSFINLFSFIIACTLSAHPNATKTSIDSFEKPKSWSTEAHLYTSSNSNSPIFGPSINYKITDHSQVGVKVLMPIGMPDSGTTSIMVLYRLYFSPEKTSLFFESSLAANWYLFRYADMVESPSIGTNIGVIHRLTDDMSFGGIAGIEWTSVRIYKDYAIDDAKSKQKNSVYPWPRIGLFASLNF